jgi:hypothetical protein
LPALVQTFGGQQGQGLAQGVDTRNGRRVMIPVHHKHQTRPKSMHSQTAKKAKCSQSASRERDFPSRLVIYSPQYQRNKYALSMAKSVRMTGHGPFFKCPNSGKETAGQFANVRQSVWFWGTCRERPESRVATDRHRQDILIRHERDKKAARKKRTKADKERLAVLTSAVDRRIPSSWPANSCRSRTT